MTHRTALATAALMACRTLSCAKAQNPSPPDFGQNVKAVDAQATVIDTEGNFSFVGWIPGYNPDAGQPDGETRQSEVIRKDLSDGFSGYQIRDGNLGIGGGDLPGHGEFVAISEPGTPLLSRTALSGLLLCSSRARS